RLRLDLPVRPVDLPPFPTRRSSDLYEVEVRVTCATFDDFEKTYSVTMAPRPVSAPYANSGSLMYQPGTTSGEGVMLQGVLNVNRSEEHTSELQSRFDLVCRLLLEQK